MNVKTYNGEFILNGEGDLTFTHNRAAWTFRAEPPDSRLIAKPEMRFQNFTTIGMGRGRLRDKLRNCWTLWKFMRGASGA